MVEEIRRPWSFSLLAFASFWPAMVLAMMLPSNVPMLNAFLGADGGRDRPSTTVAFLASYVVVWTAFGAAAFVADMGVHSLVHSWHWLHEHEWAILAATLAVVGAFQLVPAKRRYLEQCRYLTNRIARHPGKGWVDASVQGLRYGKCELSCCWALMLLMFATGHTLAWLLVLTGAVLAEKILPRGELLAQLTGTVLVIASCLLVISNIV